MNAKRTYKLVLSVTSSAVLELLEQYECPSTCVPQSDVSLSAFSLN